MPSAAVPDSSRVQCREYRRSPPSGRSGHHAGHHREQEGNPHLYCDSERYGDTYCDIGFHASSNGKRRADVVPIITLGGCAPASGASPSTPVPAYRRLKFRYADRQSTSPTNGPRTTGRDCIWVRAVKHIQASDKGDNAQRKCLQQADFHDE